MEKEDKPKEAKVVKFSDYTEKLKEKQRQIILQKILDRGNPLDKK